MKRLHISLVTALAVASLALVSCGQPVPTPTQAPAAAAAKAAAQPTYAPSYTAKPAATAAPTSASAAPTAAPAKKVDWPEKGKTITILNPAATGGDIQVQANVLIPILEKELGGGVTVQIISKSAAGGQEAYTQLAQAKPDGYTIGYTLIPTIMTQYLDPARQAIYTKKSFIPLAMHSWEPGALVVLPNSPFKTVKDMVEAARAKPESVKTGDAGILNAGNLAILQLQEDAKVKFAIVHFEGGAPLVTAQLGGHIDSAFTFVPNVVTHVKNNALRVLAVVDDQPSKYLPGVPSISQAGYKATGFTSSIRPISAPAGTPPEIVEILRGALNRALTSPEHVNKLQELSFAQRVMTPDQIDQLWTQVESDIKPYMALSR